MKKILIGLAMLVAFSGCGVQSIPQSHNDVEAAFAEVNNQYKRRADLIPNLVSTVKGYASHEQETLESVISARAKATSIQVDPQNLDPEKIQQFQQAQGQLSQALGKLMVVSERYPDLKANQNFRDLQAQLEGTENRITVARNRYIDSVKNFNNLVAVPPTSWTNSLFYDYEKLPQWQVSAEEQERNEQAPSVEF